MPAMAPPSQKLQNILKDFQQMASMAGFVNHSYDAPQLRLMFTLYGRIKASTEEEAQSYAPRMQSWADGLMERMRSESSGAVLLSQISVGNPQTSGDGGGYLLVSTLTFNAKVTENSYLRTRTAILAAYQEAIRLRDKGFTPAEG
jgi:hypothetical protein